ncbi:DEN2D protein, partial [Polypterus senegalus]
MSTPASGTCSDGSRRGFWDLEFLEGRVAFFGELRSAFNIFSTSRSATSRPSLPSCGLSDASLASPFPFGKTKSVSLGSKVQTAGRGAPPSQTAPGLLPCPLSAAIMRKSISRCSGRQEKAVVFGAVSFSPRSLQVVISKVHARDKIFDEVEKRRQISLSMIYPFMQSLRELPFPAPGHTVKVKSFIPDSGTEIIELTRPRDSQLEHVDFRTLFQRLSTEEVIYVFAATVLERRIIFVAEELSTLSQCIHAVTALLYPFIWQHTLIPIVPEIMIDVAMAPTPYLLGVQKQLMGDVLGQEEVGDEKSLLPVKLQEEILQMLNVRNDDATLEELNKIVSEAFLHFFVRTIGHFSSFVKRKNNDGEGEFQKRSFYKSIDSKNTRKFVKKFLQTQMFDLFIQGVEQRTNLQDGVWPPGGHNVNSRLNLGHGTICLFLGIDSVVSTAEHYLSAVNWLPSDYRKAPSSQ